MFVCLYICLSVFRTLSQKALQLKSSNFTLTFHHKSWKIIYFRVKRSKVKIMRHKKQCRHGLSHTCECWVLLVSVCSSGQEWWQDIINTTSHLIWLLVHNTTVVKLTARWAVTVIMKCQVFQRHQCGRSLLWCANVTHGCIKCSCCSVSVQFIHSQPDID